VTVSWHHNKPDARQLVFLNCNKIVTSETPRERSGFVYTTKGPLPDTLTLFLTKICYFCYPTYDLAKKFDSVAGTVALNLSFEGILLTVLLSAKS